MASFSLQRFVARQAPPLLAGLFLLPLLCMAEPWEPPSGDTVLVNLGAALQSHWQRSPASESSIEQRLTQARLLLDDARHGNGDAYGQAEALLQGVVMQSLTGDEAPAFAEAYYLMAYIKQHNHEFPEALHLLNQLLARYPAHQAAILQRAQIHLVTGDHDAARQDCQALAYRISDALVVSCAAQVAAVSGQIEQASQALQQLLLAGNVSDDERFELQLTQATMAEQLGDDERALMLYLDLMAHAPDSSFLLQHLADLYLRSGNAGSAIALIEARSDTSLELQVILLRALLANDEQQKAVALREQLHAQFTAARARGEEDFPHKEYSLFMLHVQNDPVAALQAARNNWQLQKEPGDLLLLAQCAQAARDEQTLIEVQQWQRKTQLQDHRVEQLLQQVSL